MIKKLIKLANHLDSKGFEKEASTLDEMIQKLAENEIGESEPYVVIDSKEGRIVYLTSYGKRNKARNWKDRKDREYGRSRYITKFILEDSPDYIRLKEKLAEGSGPCSLPLVNGIE